MSGLDAEYRMKKSSLDRSNELHRTKFAELKECKAKIEDATHEAARLTGWQKRRHEDEVLAPLRARRSRLAMQLGEIERERSSLDLSLREARSKLAKVVDNFENFFVRAAKRLLPDGTFRELMETAAADHAKAKAATSGVTASGSAIEPLAGVAPMKERSRAR